MTEQAPEQPRKNLLAQSIPTGPAVTLLPAEPELEMRFAAGEEAADIAAAFPTSSLPWAILAEEAYAEGRVIEAYAYARTGYHRGLDALRRHGWRGVGPIPWSHEPNRGFLRALYTLGLAAGSISEADEAQRISAFLNDSDPQALAELGKIHPGR
ncbi:DUF3151 domain-containing protein [Acaricomes phytoseiuli]|uniref:DUF3151 domain-containing protein n=1 Tax=Acaricomes phytoseiuli TaxID=291968 RepID=UPI002223DE95|nr:DUF3151 domain-containing protein [Acaricomes phytoseiuli]MCW1250628.1 DUF3151 domain-containing protein [Acaricomes phytoseiuli]